MILLVAIGWALERFAGVRDAMILSLFAGFFVAPFIPLGGGSCGGAGNPHRHPGSAPGGNSSSSGTN